MPDMPRSQLLAYAALAVVIGLLGARYVRSADAGGAPVRGTTSATNPVRLSAGGRSAVVHVAGAVRRPGVYELGPGARVQDAVRRAGGARRGANLDGINLAARVADGQQIIVPATAEVPAGADPTAVASSAPVSLGSATLEQLETLDGVGPATAQKIVAYRTEHGGFRSVDDLANVPGIGPKKLAAIKPHVQP